MKRPNVIILGAGAAGLAAAQVLSEAGRSVLLLEARDRIGGRIHTIRDGDISTPIELGAEFIHGRPEITLQMLREAKLTAFDLPFDHRQRRNGHLAHLEDFSEELNKVMGGLAHLAKRDMSFAEYLRNRRSSPALNDALKFAINFVQGFDAADPERISAKSLAEEMQGIGDLSNQTQFRLLDGYGALMEHLRDTLDVKKVEIKLQTQATEIRWGKSGVEVKTTGVNGPEMQRPAKLVTMLEHFDCHDWASDPFSRGAYSYVTVGGARARSLLARPIENTLFFAGEATDTEGQASTVAGALASGQRAANEVLRK